MRLIEFIGLPNHHYVLEDQILLEMSLMLFSRQEEILAHRGKREMCCTSIQKSVVKESKLIMTD